MWTDTLPRSERRASWRLFSSLPEPALEPVFVHSPRLKRRISEERTPFAKYNRLKKQSHRRNFHRQPALVRAKKERYPFW